MATKTFEGLKQMAIQIRDEKANKQNTATRIGTQMLEHLNKLEQEYYDKTNIDEQKKQTDVKFSELESKIGGIGYITCETASGTAAKTITLTGLTALSTGIRLLIKMTNANTASNATLNINSFGAKPLFYNNKRVSTDNTWVAGEVIDIYYDGTNFYSSNVQGGSGASGNIILEWNTDAATTRKQVKQSERKTLLQISYKNSEGNTVNEQYIGTAYTDTEWAKDSNWEKIPNQEQIAILEYNSKIRYSIHNITWTEGYQWIADKSNSSFGQKMKSTTGRKASNLINIEIYSIVEYTALVGTTGSTGGLVFFDIVEQPISGEFFVGQSLGYKTRKIVSPENAVYVAFSAWIESTYGDFSAKILLNSTNSKYEDYTDSYKRFKVKVNQTPIPYWDTVDESTATDTLDDNEDLADCTGVIALPSTYTADGTPTRLILFAHGGHGYVDDTHWYPTNSNFPKLLENLLDAGYAVFDCNGYKDTPYETISEWWANGDVQISEGLPQVIEAYYKCYQYIIAHYNVYPQVYIWGCSQGGHLAMNIGYMHREIVACIAMCAGQIDLYDQGYCYQGVFNRKQVAKLLGFTNQDGSVEAYEHYKADPFDPMKRITTIGDTDYVLGWNIPVKFFYGTADGILPQIQYTKKLVKALQNSKTICQLRWFKGLGHDDIAVGANSIALKEIINWFNRF